MSAHVFRQTLRRSADRTRFAAIRNRCDSALLGNLAILASTTTGEVADPIRMPAVTRAARITLLRSRSVRNV
ncbi:hypothetical protein [Mycetocola sp.]|uniref:hypothetical protein n=1 Tax=Mycetocola sp. TaxID=1871042 RepID=UPI0039894272